MRLLTPILLLFLSMPLFAQKAGAVLDKAADAIRNGGTIHATFKVTLFNGTDERESTTGEMWMNRECYKMVTPELSIWYDGQTLYSYMTGSDEAYTSLPDDQGPLGTGPYRFLYLYKKGYRTSLEKGALRGESVYTIRLQARNAETQPQTVILDIRQSDNRIMCIRANQGGDWTRIALQSYQTRVTTPQDFFTFKPAEHPNVQVVDLR